MSDWSIKGDYMETCNCEYLCPCISSNLSAAPTDGDCRVAIALRIEEGAKGDVGLDGLSFIILIHSPGAMGAGNLKVGLIVDERADDAQTAAIADIATGAAGGPMAALGPLVGEVAGLEKRPIEFVSDGMSYSVKAGDLVEQSLEAVASALPSGGPMFLDNVFHPVATKIGLAKATKTRFNAFGIDWEDASGTKNGHFAPFSWAA